MNQPIDPYQPPVASVSGEDRRVDSLEPAGRWRRFGTYVVDYIVYVIFAGITGAFVAIVFGEAGVDAMQGPMQYVVAFGVIIGYYLVFETVFQRTPGKWVCGTLVVDDQGNPPSFKKVLGRTACRFIPFEPFSMFAESRIAWHDSLPGTRVVRSGGAR